jgi:hypothetical protein
VPSGVPGSRRATTRRLGVWLCSWRAATAKPVCPHPEVVEKAICFGRIDSTVNTVDDGRGLQPVAPRKRKSTWTRLNRQRVADMEATGLMTDAGTTMRNANRVWGSRAG